MSSHAALLTLLTNQLLLLLMSENWGIWNEWTYCEIPGDMEVRFRNEGGDTTALCASCGFQKDDWDSTLGLGKASIRRYFPCQL